MGWTDEGRKKGRVGCGQKDEKGNEREDEGKDSIR